MEAGWKKTFAIIYTGQAFSLLGSAAVQFAVVWWLTVTTESALMLTLSTIVAFLPNMLIGPFAGVWIDRLSRRLVMMVADGVVALSSLILAIVFLFVENPSIWLVFSMLFLRGLGNTFHAPAMQAAIPLLVPVERLTQAGGWGNLITSLSSMIGPVIGAALMATFPISAIMLVDIFGALFAIGCLFFVKIPNVRQNAQAPDFLSDWKQGFAAIKQNKPILRFLPGMLLCNILYVPLGSLFPLLVRSHFGGGAWHNSVAEFVFAGGLLASSLIIGIWGGMRRRFLMASLAIVVMGIGSALSGALPPSGFIPFVVCCFIIGGTGSFFSVPVIAYMQETTPPEMMGKVFSLLTTAMMLAMPVGLLLAGPASEWIGIDRWFLFSGIALVLAGVVTRLMTRRYDVQTMKPE